MPRVRLLVLLLLACSAFTFAQRASERPESNSTIVQQSSDSAFNLEAKSDSEPWRIIPRDLSSPKSAQDGIEHPDFDANQSRTGQKKKFVWESTPNSGAQTASKPEGVNPGDMMCLTMRTYVVARDNKHSDSTHLVGYSTCQPALRYGLKKVDSAPSQTNR